MRVPVIAGNWKMNPTDLADAVRLALNVRQAADALPDVTTVRPVALAIAVVAAVLVFRLKWSVLRTLGVCALLGLAAGLAGLPVS